MRVLIFGLPGSGKTTLARELMGTLPCLYLNGDRVREIFADKDFSLAARVKQARRMRAMADMAVNIPVIADFVCPTEETRDIFDPDFSIWMYTIDRGRYEDTNKIFEAPQKVDYTITSKDAKKYAEEIIKMIKNRKLL